METLAESKKKIDAALPELTEKLHELQNSEDGRFKELIKDGLVDPLVEALGYLKNDIKLLYPIGNGQRVDVAILMGGMPRIFIDICDLCENLDAAYLQSAVWGNAGCNGALFVLTNGDEYRVFILDENHSKKENAFFLMRVSLKDLREDGAAIEKFVKYMSHVGVENWVIHEDGLLGQFVYERVFEVLKKALGETPDDDFVQYVLKRAGVLCESAIERGRYGEWVKRAMDDLRKSGMAKLPLLGLLPMVEFWSGIVAGGQNGGTAFEGCGTLSEEAKGDGISDDVGCSGFCNDDCGGGFELRLNDRDIERSSNIRVLSCYWGNERLRAKNNSCHLKQAVVVMIQKLEQLHPGKLREIAASGWRTSNKGHPYVAEKIPDLLASRYGYYCNMYIYLNMNNPHMLLFLRELIERYGEDPSMFLLRVERSG